MPMRFHSARHACALVYKRRQEGRHAGEIWLLLTFDARLRDTAMPCHADVAAFHARATLIFMVACRTPPPNIQ